MGNRFRLVSFLAVGATAAACASPEAFRGPVDAPYRAEDDGTPVRGNIDLTLWGSGADGRVAAEGGVDSASGSPRAWGIGASLDALTDDWSFYLDAAAENLPSDLDLGDGFLTNSRTEYHHFDLAVGLKILEIPSGDAANRPESGALEPRPLLRIDPFVGLRRSTLVTAEDFLGVLPVERHGDPFTDGFAGLRVESRLSDQFLVRIRGDTLVAGRSENAWKATATIVIGSGTTRLALGWQCLSIDFETGSGNGLVRYDVFLSGPFVSLEILL